jgi:predicted oxidoreductase
VEILKKYFLILKEFWKGIQKKHILDKEGENMERIQLAEDLSFSRVIHGHWRLAEWNLKKEELLSFIEQCLELGITTFDHADIYGNYTCEVKFDEALALKPEWRQNIANRDKMWD